MRWSDAEDSSTSPLLPTNSSDARKTHISINIYDLLPPGRLASFLWNIGAACVHSGVVIGDREYAFGAHQKPGVTGVYFTRPKLEPPGGTFRCEIVHGFSLVSQDEIEVLILEASQKFLGPDWQLLKNNCNHFTSYICEVLTGKAAPSFLNRAANIGVCLPCIIPQDWVQPPDAGTAEGELLEHEDGESEQDSTLNHPDDPDIQDDNHDHEAYLMSDASSTDDDMRLKWRRKRRSYKQNSSFDSEYRRANAGRPVTVSETAPVPKNRTI